MIVKGPKDVKIGNLYMYNSWNYGCHKLECGVCVGVDEERMTLKDKERTYLGPQYVYFLSDIFPKKEFKMIADYDKRIFNAYNKRIENLENDLKDIWNGKIKRERKRKKKCFWKKVAKILKRKD